MPSLISTVYNESNNIKQLISDIKNQTSQPTEVIIVDAGSTDGTYEDLASHFEVLQKKGVGRSEGRNIAISQASSDVIVACDAGTKIDPNWFYELTKHFKDSDVDIVSGFFKPDANNFFEKCMASATIPILDEIEPDKFLPSSRSIAFRKSAWKNVDGYPEWLPICEDLVFDIKLKLKGFKFKFEPKAIVFWKPRTSIKAFFKQYFNYARGDGHAKLWFARHMIRYTAYVTGFLFIYLSFNDSFLWLLPLFAAQIGYFSKFYYRYLGHFQTEAEYKMLASFPFISLLVIVGDIAKMFGYPIGIYERLTGKIKFERYR